MLIIMTQRERKLNDAGGRRDHGWKNTHVRKEGMRFTEKMGGPAWIDV